MILPTTLLNSHKGSPMTTCPHTYTTTIGPATKCTACGAVWVTEEGEPE